MEKTAYRIAGAFSCLLAIVALPFAVVCFVILVFPFNILFGALALFGSGFFGVIGAHFLISGTPYQRDVDVPLEPRSTARQLKDVLSWAAPIGVGLFAGLLWSGLNYRNSQSAFFDFLVGGAGSALITYLIFRGFLGLINLLPRQIEVRDSVSPLQAKSESHNVVVPITVTTSPEPSAPLDVEIRPMRWSRLILAIFIMCSGLIATGLYLLWQHPHVKFPGIALIVIPGIVLVQASLFALVRLIAPH